MTPRPRQSPSGRFLDRATLRDEFMGGSAAVFTSSTSNANIGELNWNLAALVGGACDVRSQPATPSGMRGWYQIEAAIGDIIGPHLGASQATSGGFFVDDFVFFNWRGTFNGPIFPAADGAGRFGAGLAAGQPSFGDRGLFFEFSPSLGNVLRTVSRWNSVETARETGIEWEPGRVYDLTVVRSQLDRFVFLIDDQVVNTHDGARGDIVPPADALIGAMCHADASAAAANHQIGADRFEFEPR
jgi:hypothetical protein